MTAHKLAKELLKCKDLPVLMLQSVYKNDGDFSYEEVAMVDPQPLGLATEEVFMMAQNGDIVPVVDACPDGAIILG